MKSPFTKSLGLSESVGSDGGFLVAPACPKCGVHLNGDKCPKCHYRWTKIAQKNLTKRELDAAAKDVHPNPTLAQKEAGNYAKGHVSWQGIPITIESAKGTKRRGQSRAGVKWSVTMRNHYGYIKRTKSDADGDQIDVFLADDGKPGTDLNSDIVFVVNQHKLNGDFDEHKCMLGFTNAEAAKAAYLSNYSPGWNGFGSIAPMTLDRFKEWINGKTGKPVAKALITFDDIRGASDERPSGPHRFFSVQDLKDHERISIIADILGGCFGWKGVSLFGKDRGEKHLQHICKGWNKLDHPRGPNGRFIPKNSPEALATAKTAIERALHGRQNTESHRALVEHLAILSTGQLHALKKEYGLSASAEDKPKLVAKLADRLNKGRRQTDAESVRQNAAEQPNERPQDTTESKDADSYGVRKLVAEQPNEQLPEPAPEMASPQPSVVEKESGGSDSDIEVTQAKRQPIHDDIERAVREFGGEGNRIYLADIRDRLPQHDHRAVSNALFDMSRADELSLYQLDDPREITPRHRDAAVQTSTGKERHILYYGGISSGSGGRFGKFKESGSGSSAGDVHDPKVPTPTQTSYLDNNIPPSVAPKKNGDPFLAQQTASMSKPAKAQPPFDVTYARYLKATSKRDSDLNRFAHERLVKEAQAYGQPISDAVLDEYPHLRAKPQVALDANLRANPGKVPVNADISGLLRTSADFVRTSREIHVSGATFRHKDAIRQAGGSWDKAKGVWIVTPTGAGKLAKLPGLHFGGPGKAKRLGGMKSPFRTKRIRA